MSRVHACLAVTCHQLFWQNDRGLLRATAVTRGWNGQRIRVSTQSCLWRRKFSRRSCRDWNSQPFDHESGAPTDKLSPLGVALNPLTMTTGPLSFHQCESPLTPVYNEAHTGWRAGTGYVRPNVHKFPTSAVRGNVVSLNIVAARFFRRRR